MTKVEKAVATLQKLKEKKKLLDKQIVAAEKAVKDAKKPVAKKPAAKKPAGKKPVAKKPAAKKPGGKK